MKMGGCQFVRIACLFMLVLAGHGRGSVTPWKIEVKGIAAILDDRRVFIATQDPAGVEKNHVLVEGQSCGGIKLLSVDVKNSVAKFDNHGTLQFLRICSTPELTMASAASRNQTATASLARPAAMAGTPVQASTAANSSKETVEGFNSGFATVAASAASGKDSSSKNSSTDSGNTSTDTTTSTGTITRKEAATGMDTANGSAKETSSLSASSSSEINSWWYTGSQDIEQARLETEDAVRQGILPAYPLTPLTPRGTPPELIGAGQAFFNHFATPYRVN